jgi:hypothetical protein
MEAQEAAGTAAPQPQQAETDVAPASDKYRVKVDGEELEVDIDELRRGYQLSRASTKRFEEASKLYKQVQPLLSAREKADLNGLLEGIPDDKKREWAEHYLSEWLKYQELDPKDRENLEYKKKLSHYEKQEQARKEAEQKQREEQVQAQLRSKAQQEIDDELSEVLKSIPKEKRSPRLVARIAEEMLAHWQSRQSKLPAKAAYERATQALKQDVTDVLGSLETEQLVQILPKEVVNKLLKFHADRVKSQSPFGNRSPTTSDPKPSGKKRMDTDSFFNKLDQKYRSR